MADLVITLPKSNTDEQDEKCLSIVRNHIPKYMIYMTVNHPDDPVMTTVTMEIIGIPHEEEATELGQSILSEMYSEKIYANARVFDGLPYRAFIEN